MDSRKRKALEAAGWRFGDAADFLEMTDEERQLLDARIEMALAVRRQRESLKLTQQQLASRLKTSQPRIAKIERAAPDVSLDQILRAFAAIGGRIAVKQVGRTRPTKTTGRSASAGREKAKSIPTPQVSEMQIELMEAE
ncbi:MAG TPA: XRE family transcriptional regulator [Gemmataceae bacterium]|jgi:transcriptional regulator with XRE-family HTH domain